MSKILKVSESDYRLKVVSGGNITLDTGANTGVVTITGSLVYKAITLQLMFLIYKLKTTLFFSTKEKPVLALRKALLEYKLTEVHSMTLDLCGMKH